MQQRGRKKRTQLVERKSKIRADIPRLIEKLDAARQGKFRPYNPDSYGKLSNPQSAIRNCL
jgi:hypothetical protein